VQGLFSDGRTARAHAVQVRVEDEVLIFSAAEEHCWPLSGVRLETVDDRIRVAPPGEDAARLTMALADWSDLTAHATGHHQALRRRHVALVAGLAAAAAAVAALVFVVIPAVSGPLARLTPPKLERQIGDNLAAQVSLGFPACRGKDGQRVLASFGQRLGKASGTPFDIRVRAVHAPMVNAFALPGGTIMVTDRLITLVASPDELSSVIAHETAHVQKRHVMQAVWRSFGFGVLLDAVVGGGSGAGQQAVLLIGSSTNLRYSRAAEADADAGGQVLLQSQGLSSQGMAPFFQRLVASREGKNAEAVKELLSDHPDTLRRADASRARARPGAAAFTAAEWTAIRASCRDGYDPLKPVRRFF
jgi:predicted Zn-dependent protease